MKESANNLEREKIHEEIHKKYDYVAENVIEIVRPEFSGNLEAALSRIADGIMFNKSDTGRFGNGLTMNINWGTQGPRTAYDMISSNYLQKIEQREIGVQFEDVPEIMRQSFSIFEAGGCLVWSEIKIEGILLMAGTSISGEPKKEFERKARLFPNDAGLWMATGSEVVEEIIRQIEDREGNDVSDLENRVKEKLGKIIAGLESGGMPTVKSIESSFLVAHGDDSVTLDETIDSFDSSTLERLRREGTVLTEETQEWFEDQNWVVSLDESTENSGDNKEWIVSPLTGGPMSLDAVWAKGALPPIRGLARDTVTEMPKYLADLLETEGWSASAYYKQDGAIPYFAQAENGANLVVMNENGHFGGFQWDKQPIGKIRFFKGFDPEKAAEYRKEQEERWRAELKELSGKPEVKLEKIEGMHPLTAIETLKSQIENTRQTRGKNEEVEHKRMEHELKLISQLEEHGWGYDRLSGAKLPETVVIVTQESHGVKRDPDCLMVYPQGSMSEEDFRALMANMAYGSEIEFAELSDKIQIKIVTEKAGLVIGSGGKHINAIKGAIYKHFGKSVQIKVTSKEK